MRIESFFVSAFGEIQFDSFVPKHFQQKNIHKCSWHQMHHVGRDELAHVRWKSRRLLAVVSLLFGVGETNCSQGSSEIDRFPEQM